MLTEYADKGPLRVELAPGDMVDFYTLIPLYQHEYKYKKTYDDSLLLKRLRKNKDFNGVVDLSREPVVKKRRNPYIWVKKNY